MKKLIIMVFLLYTVELITAFPVSFKEAEQVAEHHIIVCNKTNHKILEYFEIKDTHQNTLSYVFNLQPEGFIAVSADTDIYPIIGYSFINNFSNQDIPVNIGYQYLKNDMRLRLEAIPITVESVKKENRILWYKYLAGTYEQTHNRNYIYPPEGYSSTEGWIETQWHQNAPYNNFCPIDPDTNLRSLVGCGATAFGQILNYHRYIGDAQFNDDDDYVSDHFTSPVYIDDDYLLYDFPSFPQLNPYLVEIDQLYAAYEDITDDLLPAFNFAAGVALRSDYSSSVTGLYSISPIQIAAKFISKFNFIDSQVVYYSNPHFYDYLQTNMISACPAFFLIHGTGGSSHFIACDGYNGNDNTYHLNMGWAGSSDGWYNLPAGMPAGYHTIVYEIVEIEGGTIPFNVSGLVTANGANLEETHITFDGPRYHELYNVEANGNYEIPILFPANYEITAVIELPNGGYYYLNDIYYLDENNNVLDLPLDNYEFFTGTVSAPVSPLDTNINILQNDELLRSGLSDENGDFSLPGVLPGTYTVAAGLEGMYYDIQPIEVTANNQSVDFTLMEYPYEYEFNFAGDPVGSLQLFQYMSCAIRLDQSNVSNHEDNILSRIEFIAPFDPTDGNLYAQVWKNEQLISEQQIFDFSIGYEIDLILNDIIIIDASAEYYVGYRIESTSGNIDAAYHDDGPRVEGHGAYIYTSTWMALPDIHDFNFCIKAFVVSEDEIGSDLSEIPSPKFELSNYPNPFNPTTEIRYQIPELSEIVLSIYNIKGQLIKSLVDEMKSAGKYSVIWEGRDDKNRSVPSGIYLYRLSTKDDSKIRKMILLR